MDRNKRLPPDLIARLIGLAAFLAIFIFITIHWGPDITRLISHADVFKDYIDSYGWAGAFVFILVQAVQVIIFIIPGEIVQVAGGYVFGTFLGTLYSLIGILAGTVVAFFAARLIGYSLVKAILPRKDLDKFEFLINSPKSEIAMFILFLIPGIPKDALVYVSGLTPVKPLRFVVICMIARFPGLWGSAYIGANLQHKHYLPVWIVSGIALVLFTAGVLTKDKIIARLHRLRRPKNALPPVPPPPATPPVPPSGN